MLIPHKHKGFEKLTAFKVANLGYTGRTATTVLCASRSQHISSRVSFTHVEFLLNCCDDGFVVHIHLITIHINSLENASLFASFILLRNSILAYRIFLIKQHNHALDNLHFPFGQIVHEHTSFSDRSELPLRLENIAQFVYHFVTKKEALLCQQSSQALIWETDPMIYLHSATPTMNKGDESGLKFYQ
mgnify:CR=1 FL=1